MSEVVVGEGLGMVPWYKFYSELLNFEVFKITSKRYLVFVKRSNFLYYFRRRRFLLTIVVERLTVAQYTLI